MAIPSLRITAKFDPIIAEQIKTSTNQDNQALTNAIIVDDAANLIHEVNIEYDSDDDGNIYRRLNYKMTSMVSGKVVLNAQNMMAQELLYKIATALTGSTLFYLEPESNRYVNRNFDRSMFVLGSNDGVWDDVLPIDLDKTRKTTAKKESK